MYTSSASVISSSRTEGGRTLLEQRLNGVATFQQMSAIHVQFLGQVLRREALRNTPQNLENKSAGVARFTKDGAGKEIKDGAALATAIFEDRRTMAIMGRLIGWQGMAVRTDQAIGVEPVAQICIASVLVQEIGDRPD
jgi:hypothetical protein